MSRSQFAWKPSALAFVRPILQGLIAQQNLKLLLYALAILSAYIGSVYARGRNEIPRDNYYSLDYAAPWLIAGFMLWLLAEVAGDWQKLVAGWRILDERGRRLWLARILPALMCAGGLATLWQSMRHAPQPGAVGMALNSILLLAVGGALWLLIGWLYRRDKHAPTDRPGAASRICERQPLRPPIWREISHRRKLMIIVAVGGSLMLWLDADGNTISNAGIALWIFLPLLWCLVFVPLRWNFFDWSAAKIDGWQRFQPGRHLWAALIFAALMLLGFSFRYGKLDQYPHHIVGDMVDKVERARQLDFNSEIPIHFTVGDSREPLYHYLLAIFSSLEGMDFDYFAAKRLSALCALLALPFIFLLGVETIGWKEDGRRNQALATGLIALGLVAGSFWHVALARIGMRAVITATWTAPLLVFYARALRHNRRSDFVLAGLFMGLNLISYPSSRLMPICVVAGVLITLLLRDISWRERARYLLNLAALTLISFAVFLPALRYLTEYPELFWMRSNRNIYGDHPTAYESFDATLEDMGGRFLRNWHKQLLMYHYSFDDGMWSAPGVPSVSQHTAALALLGGAALLAWMARTRDPFICCLPLILVFTLAPSALTLAFPAEVPHTPRGYSAIVPSYLIAALPLALFCRQIARCLPRLPGLAAGFAFAALVILSSYNYNADYYFGTYTDIFHGREPQLTAARALRDYLDSGGAKGNAMFVDYPHWLDTRAAGMHAGIAAFNNSAGINKIPNLVRRNLTRGEAWRIDPNRDIIFLHAPHDEAAPRLLQEWFPQGKSVYIEPVESSNGLFVFRVPALGEDRLQAFVDEYAR